MARMCNEYERHIRWAEYCRMLDLSLGIPTRQSELDLPPSDDVRINETAPVMREADDGIELVPMNFSFPPSGARGGPVFNFRSEGRQFDTTNRCLIPASAFVEFTGKKYPKTKHRFTLNGAPFMAIAGIERGERVSDNALDRIAQAFGYEAGYFTAPRLPLDAEEAAASLVETYSHLEIVPVGPMTSHRAVRDAARCDAVLIHRPEVSDVYDDDIAGLQEWLDLASFILSDIADPPPSERGRRDLYNDILACVGDLERRGLTVLSGVMPAPQDRLPDWKVAVVSITPRLTDPGAAKRRHLMVDRRVVTLPSGPKTT